MADDYGAMAEVFRWFEGRWGRPSLEARDLAARTGLDEESVRHALTALQRRGYVTSFSGGPVSWTVTGPGRSLAGKNAAQLLALDALAWIDGQARGGAQQVSVEQLPAELRADHDLFELALDDLATAGAITVHRAPHWPDEIMFRPARRTYRFGTGRPLTPVQVAQHVGDVVGGDKVSGDKVSGDKINTSDGCAVATNGGTATVNADAGTAAALAALIEHLRAQGEINAQALDLLAKAAEPGVAPNAATAYAYAATQRDPRLRDKVLGFLASVAASYAGSALFEAVRSAQLMM